MLQGLNTVTFICFQAARKKYNIKKYIRDVKNTSMFARQPILTSDLFTVVTLEWRLGINAVPPSLRPATFTMIVLEVSLTLMLPIFFGLFIHLKLELLAQFPAPNDEK